MLFRIVTKLMLKAMVPLVVVGGVLFYADYMRGGDPAAVLRKVTAGLGSGVSASFASARHDASSAMAGLNRSTTSADIANSPLRNSQFYTWQDVHGVTHYSSTEPVGVNAQTVTVNPDTNVLAPVQAPAAALSAGAGRALPARNHESALAASQRNSALRDKKQFASKQAAAVADLEKEMGEPLPGIAGHLLSRQPDGEPGSAAMGPERIIQLLQSGGN